MNISKTFRIKTYNDYEIWSNASGLLTHAQFDLIYTCNLNCLHCYLNRNKRGRLLRTNEIKNIIDDLARFDLFCLGFSGGEIFLREDIIEILDYAASKRLKINLKTNGTLITPFIAKRLSENPFIARIDITLLGLKAKIHDSITGCPGSFQKTLNGINLLRSHLPKEKIQIVFVALKENYKEYDAILEFTRKYGLSFGFIPSLITDSCEGAMSFPRLHRLSAKEERSFYKRFDVASDFKPAKPNVEAYVCAIGRSTIYIDPFGYTHPCVILASINWGYLPKMGIKKIWESRTPKGLKLKKFPECVDCALFPYCQVCPGRNYLENKSLFKPSKESCKQALVLKSFF